MAELESRGERLRVDLRKRGFGPADEVLVEEACRIADRLDRLDALLAGDIESWATIRVPYERGSRDLELIIDDALGEARQQANALRQIFTTLKLVGVQVEEPKADGVDEIAAKRAARRAGAQI